MFDFGDGIRFLSLVVRNALKRAERDISTYYFLRREDSELNLSHFADGCRRVRELVAEHGERQETGKGNGKSRQKPSAEQKRSPGIEDSERDEQEGGE